MSAPDNTIARGAPADIGQDYARLVVQGTALLQQMSGQVWTNYNYSDPGVTILEQLCYALTELSYRADFPVQDLLGAAVSGRVSLARHGLHPARTIMTASPVTADDLRRLILDRVPEVGNVWCTPLAAGDAGGNSGLYRIDVLAQPDHCDCTPADHGPLRARVLDCYAAHRALCEDVQLCRVLTPLPAHVGADVRLAEGSDPDLALAQLQFAIGMLLTPEPQRRSLAQQLAAGLPTAAIFDGPQMLRGFIADDQLGPQPQVAQVDDVLDAMAGVAGVLSVDNLTLWIGADSQPYRPGQHYDLPDGAVLQLQPNGRGGRPAIRLSVGGAACRTHPARVRRLLERAWAAQRRTYRLPDEYRAHYQVPVGRRHDLADYTSVQQQFPAVYGIGAYGLPGDADAARKAQARQLKGYLMPFDQLMADYFSQLGFVRELYSVGAGGQHSYAWQSLAPLVPDCGPLLQPGYAAGMAALVAAYDPVATRQAAVLDFLLSLYAETLAAPPEAGDAWQAAVLDAKRALLTQMVPATRDRGRGYDYRRGAHPRNLAGMEIRCRIELALAGASVAAVTAAVGDAGDSATADDAGAPTVPVDAGGQRAQPLYIVEWLLLRYALLDDKRPLHADDMGFRISAVLPERRGPQDGDDSDDSDDPEGDQAWRERAHAIVRANTPAHIVVDTLFLDQGRMQRFMPLYDEWTGALQHGSSERRREASRKLAHFLRPSALQAASKKPAMPEAAALPPPIPVVSDIVAPARPPVQRAEAPSDGAAAAAATLPGAPGPAPAGAYGLRIRAKMVEDQARALLAQGFRFVLRDLGTTAWPTQATLDNVEATVILLSGLALMPVQAVPDTGWMPGEQQGRLDGERAVADARSIGLPVGVTLWLHTGQHLPAGATVDQLASYCRAWRDSVAAAGHQCGLYLPPAALADAGRLAALGFARYGQPQGCQEGLSGRGPCLVRMAPMARRIDAAGEVDGPRCDWHFVQTDHRGGTPDWMGPLAAGASA